MGGVTPAAGAPDAVPPLDPEPARAEQAMLALQAGRVRFTSAVMRLRYAPLDERRRVLPRAVISFVRLQRLTEAAAQALGPDRAEAP